MGQQHPAAIQFAALSELDQADVIRLIEERTQRCTVPCIVPSFPHQLWPIIFSFFSSCYPSDFTVVRLVCKEWMDGVSKGVSKLIIPESVQVTNHVIIFPIFPSVTNLTFSRGVVTDVAHSFSNLVSLSILPNVDASQVIERYSGISLLTNLTHLTLKGNNLARCVKYLTSLPKLRRLTLISNIYAAIFMPLLNLERLDLLENSGIGGNDLKLFTSLRTLKIIGCRTIPTHLRS